MHKVAPQAGGDGAGARRGRRRSMRDEGAVYCVRIANFPNTDVSNTKFEPGMNRWLSSRDMAELTACCLEAPDPQFGIFYGVSKGADKKWDLANAKELVGWEPQDRGAESP